MQEIFKEKICVGAASNLAGLLWSMLVLVSNILNRVIECKFCGMDVVMTHIELCGI